METSEMTEQWRDSLPEQLRDAPYIKNAESIDQVLADLTNAAQWQGNSIRTPGPDATPETIAEYQDKVMEKIPGLAKVPNVEDADAMAAHFSKLGRPDAADAYKSPDDMTMDAEELGTYKALAHQANLTQAQLNDLLSGLDGARKIAGETAKAQFDTDMTALKGEWGAAYEQNYNDIGGLLKDAPADFQEAYEGGMLPAATVRWLHGLAQLGDESTQFVKQNDGGAPDILPPDEARAQLGELMAGKALWDTGDPAHQAAVAKRLRLERMIAGLAPDADLSQHAAALRA